MEKQEDKLDLVLNRAAAEEFAGVDWESLNEMVRNRLAAGRRQGRKQFRWVKFAAAAAVIIGVLFFCRTRKQGSKGSFVEIVRTKGVAKVELVREQYAEQVRVEPVGQGVRDVWCKVETIGGEGGTEARGESAFIIIRMPKAEMAYNGDAKKAEEILFLF
ncbi:MAG: hypothetical protein ABIG61_12100 [Planctomycetota bacterium]